MQNISKIFATCWDDYELIDAGGNKKLERWGKIVTIRPEIQAYFKPVLPHTEWRKLAHFEFVETSHNSGYWKEIISASHLWVINYKKIKIKLELTKFKHLGIFPEQQVNWDSLLNELESNDKFLNLFAYTGIASCVAKSIRADVFHVDSVKNLISWAKENMLKSKLNDIRWIHEDAIKFMKREEKRGNKFRGILMDPPAWGIGAKGEKWKLEDQIDELVSTSSRLLTENGFLIMNTYTPSIDIQFLQELFPLYFPNKKLNISELWMKTSTNKELYFGNLVKVEKISD